MRVGYDEQLERLQAVEGFRNARDAVAGMSLHEHRPHIVFLRDLIFRQRHRVKPTGERDAGGFHILLGIEARLQELIIDFPNPRPMLPGTFDEAVIERQRDDIEPDVGCSLHVVVAAEDVGPGAGLADIAGHQQGDATRSHVGGADGLLGLAHGPDQCCRLLRRKHLGDALELFARNAADALDLFRIPLLHVHAEIVETVDALFDELLVLPAVLEDVPHHAIEHRDVGARPHAHIFSRMGGGSRQAWVDDDKVGLLKLLALKQMLH